MTLTYYLPTRILLTPNIDIAAQVKTYGLKRVALLCGGWAVRSGLAPQLSRQLDQKGIKCSVLDGIPEEPFDDHVDHYAARLREEQAQLVIAVGGGSVLDLAKFAAYLAVAQGSCAQYDGGLPPTEAGLPLLAVPTTAGTGSEVTPYSVINNRATGKKFTVASPHFYPREALIDPLHLRTLPADYRLATGLDAWVHGWEAWLNQKRHPLTSQAALSCIRLVYDNLQKSIRDPENLEAATAMAQAALYGGMAISHSRTGAVHTCSVALAKYCDAPHGLLNAVIAPHVLRFNGPSYTPEDICLTAPNESKNWEDTVTQIESWLAQLGVPSRLLLKTFDASVMEALITRIRMDKGLADVNPQPISDQDLEQLLQNIVTTEA